MHSSVMDYVRGMVEKYDLRGKVLEVGSYNENGSVRGLFPDSRYVGVDVREGPGVDCVVPEGRFPYAAQVFDVCISTEVLEHDLRPWRTVAEMARVLRVGGYMILTARGYDGRGCYEIHDWRDNWRYSVTAMEELVRDAKLLVLDARSDPEFPGAFVTAVKP